MLLSLPVDVQPGLGRGLEDVLAGWESARLIRVRADVAQVSDPGADHLVEGVDDIKMTAGASTTWVMQSPGRVWSRMVSGHSVPMPAIATAANAWKTKGECSITVRRPTGGPF